MTTKEYLRDPSLSGRMTIKAIVVDDRPILRAAATWFHAQGGGQKADRGTIGGVEVYNVRHGPDGEVDHYVSSLDGIEVGRSYEFAIDAGWRRLNAGYHSGGHLIAAVAEARFPGLRAVNGHHWPGEARVEFVGEGVQRVVEDLAGLEDEVNRVIAEGLPIAIVGDPLVDRKVRIGAFPPLPCGGTHATLSSEIGAVQLRSAKVKGDTLRVGYGVLCSS